jgi:hypothetical protein
MNRERILSLQFLAAIRRTDVRHEEQMDPGVLKSF